MKLRLRKNLKMKKKSSKSHLPSLRIEENHQEANPHSLRLILHSNLRDLGSYIHPQKHKSLLLSQKEDF